MMLMFMNGETRKIQINSCLKVIISWKARCKCLAKSVSAQQDSLLPNQPFSVWLITEKSTYGNLSIHRCQTVHWASSGNHWISFWFKSSFLSLTGRRPSRLGQTWSAAWPVLLTVASHVLPLSDPQGVYSPQCKLWQITPALPVQHENILQWYFHIVGVGCRPRTS